MPIVLVPSLLRRYTDGEARVPVEGSTLGQAFADLVRLHPAMEGHLVDNGRVRLDISISIDDHLVDRALSHPVRPASEIAVLPAISGGQAV